MIPAALTALKQMHGDCDVRRGSQMLSRLLSPRHRCTREARSIRDRAGLASRLGGQIRKNSFEVCCIV